MKKFILITFLCLVVHATYACDPLEFQEKPRIGGHRLNSQTFQYDPSAPPYKSSKRTWYSGLRDFILKPDVSSWAIEWGVSKFVLKPLIHRMFGNFV